MAKESAGGAIVYCATKKGAEEVAQFLVAKEKRASYFHSGLPPESKKNTQERFIKGDIRVLAATNAFGMGIDKSDVRLVVHADVPGSLENYLQEAGRAGRDREAAHCVLLYTSEDVERQFGMSARARLTATEIQAILRALRRMDRKKRLDGLVVATAGEVLAEDDEKRFERDEVTDDTRVRTAVAWLEEATLLAREENQVEVFPSSLQVATVDEARARLEKHVPRADYRESLLRVVEALIGADPDEGISTDELMGIAHLNAEGVRHALQDLHQLGIAKDDTTLTAFVHQGVERSSQKRLHEAAELESALLDELREAAAELGKGEDSLLHLRQAVQRLRDKGHAAALPEKLWRILRGLAGDGRSDEGGVGSIRLRRIDAETVEVALQREWTAIAKTAELRRATAAQILQHLLACLPDGLRGTDLLAESTLGKIREAIEQDVLLKAQLRDPARALERGLLWLHEQEVIRLNRGLAVFRSAMTIRLVPEKRGFGRTEFEPLKLHYEEQVVQIHVMTEYVQRGLQSMTDALRLAIDYFTLRRDEFIRRWLPDREKDLGRQTTPESWRAIVESLNNATQQRIATDEREGTNVLVLAGPGSGKTRVLVHRIAYLVRVKRENPRGILALAYNRHAAVEIRRRLGGLIGDDAKGVTVLTCHALAMRLAGVSFAARAQRVDDDLLKTVIPQAVALLKGEGLAIEEADEQRDRLLAGFRWILVDEYQDIALEQYELISALAGRTLQDKERKLTLFAVGDDDQNIYAFNGASVEFIRRFEKDYEAKPSYLTENYRSTAHIIAAANRMIGPARDRMKADHPIRINRARSKELPGGDWQKLDPVGRGRVQILSVGKNPQLQAAAAIAEFERLAKLDGRWNWSHCAIVAREWKYLDPVRAYCESKKIPVQMASDEAPGFWRLRESQQLIEWLRGERHQLTTAIAIRKWLAAQIQTPWVDLLLEGIAEFESEASGAEVPTAQFLEWFAEWGREVRRRQSALLLLTAHRAKGLEFDHVVVLDGGWSKVGKGEDADSPRRLYYVAMTRARKTLTLSQFEGRHALLDCLADDSAVFRRAAASIPALGPELARIYERVTLRDIDLGYAGQFESHKQIHSSIKALNAGSRLRLEMERSKPVLKDESGVVVGKLANSYELPTGMQCISANVAAVITRFKSDDRPEYQGRSKCERWEIVVPELVFAPRE